jgi:uncharacterized protein YjbI with pentapeptide repeats
VVIGAPALAAHAAWLADPAAADGARLVLLDADARGQDLRSQRLAGAVIDRSTFEGAQLAASSWASARVGNTSFRGAVFADALLDDALFLECDLRDADLSCLADDGTPRPGTTARCRFERCDLRGSVWLERDLSGAVFIDCRFDLTAGTPRSVTGIDIQGATLTNPDGTTRIAAASDVLALWQVGKARPTLGNEDRAFLRKGLQGRWRKRESAATRAPRPPAATGVGSLADKWSDTDLRPERPRGPAPSGEPVSGPGRAGNDDDPAT